MELYSSGALLAELEDVLQRKKFSKKLADAQLEPRELVTGYAALATVVQPGPISPIVLRDPDDDAVIACAMTATARYIISGDGDLPALKKHNEIEILKVAEFLRRFG